MIRILLCFLFSTASFASGQIPDTDMHAMTKEVLALQRFMFSEADFLSPKNDKAIREAFPELEKHLTHLKEKVFQDQPVLRVNTLVLTEQISEAARAFREGNKPYARFMLVGSLQMCVACHTRTVSADFALPDSELKGASTLDQANYFYATRQFDKGRDLFEKYLKSAGKGESAASLRSSAMAIAIYYARIKADPQGGKEFFSKLAKEKKFTPELRERFTAWAGAFGKWAAQKQEEEADTEAKALSQAKKLLAQNSGKAGDDVRGLRASALLHNVLEMPGERTPAKAEALVELGKIYEGLDFPLYYRFGDLYLKACITEYQKSKAAQACFDQLDSFVKKRASRSAAGGAASMEEAELFKWKKLAY